VARLATTVVEEVNILSIASGGDGVARSDGLVIFIPRTARGDRVRVEATAVSGGHFARGVVKEVLTPSPDRVEPPCAHYTRDRCGGCQLQHLRYDAQLVAKGTIVEGALAHIAHRLVGPVPVEPSPLQWRYRQKLTLALRKNAGGHWEGGLHRLHASADVFPIEDCAITDQRVVDMWREVLRAGDLLPEASALRAAVRLTGCGEMEPGGNGDRVGYALVVEGGRSWPWRRAFEAAVTGITEVWWTPEGGERKAEKGERGHEKGDGKAAAGAEPDKLGEPRTGASFVQVNPEVAAALRKMVVQRVLAYAPASVVDAYSGTGATAGAIARHGVRVTAIESDPDAGARCRRMLPAGSRSVIARVEDALPAALPADVVVVNPPRAGLAASVTAVLDRSVSTTKALIYVSCDPATLARDVTRLAAWRIASVRAFDMFPQTAHVETVCELVPASGTP
jgi:23S rRNA (uracil1939-C5)-methyltransferase